MTKNFIIRYLIITCHDSIVIVHMMKEETTVLKALKLLYLSSVQAKNSFCACKLQCCYLTLLAANIITQSSFQIQLPRHGMLQKSICPGMKIPNENLGQRRILSSTYNPVKKNNVISHY